MNNILVTIGIAAGSLVLLVVGLMLTFKAFWKVSRGDEALVRTGGKQPVVTVGGGMWVIPLIHEVARVSLQAIRVPIHRTGTDAIPSKDSIPAEIQGEMFVQISPTDHAAIILALQSLGVCHPEQMAEIVQERIKSQITDALRTAAFKKTFLDLNAQKKEFGDEVAALLQEDLARMGLMLTTVAVTHVTQGAFVDDDGDIIASQGRRNVAETVQRNRKETNKIQRETEIEVQGQDVSAREQALALDLRRRQREADQARQVAEYEAEQATEQRKKVLLQDQAQAQAAVEQARTIAEAQAREAEKTAKAGIAQQEAVSIRQAQAQAAVAKAEAERKVAEEEAARLKQEAEIRRQQSVEAAEIEKQRILKVAAEAQQQAVQEAVVAREVAVAQRRADEAAARAAQAEAEANQRKAEEAVITVKAVAVADRERTTTLIKAEEAAGRERIDADKQAYITEKRAEGERRAAEQAAEACEAAARGAANAAKAEAEGYAGQITTRADADLLAAQKQSEARTLIAAALLKEGEAAAQAQRLLVEANNAVSNQTMIRDVALELVKNLPAVVHEVMAPVAAVTHDVKVLQLTGFDGAAGGNGASSTPQAILGTGLAITGALPVLREMAKGLVENEDLKTIAGAATGVVHNAIRDTVSGLAAGLRASDNGTQPPSVQ